MKSRIGEIKRSRQGLTLKLIRWVNREKVQVEILETRERQWATYLQFKKGKVVADFVNFPYHDDCTFRQAKVYTLAILGLILASLGALIYSITQ